MVLVAIGDELQQAGRDARLDDADPDAVAERDEPAAVGGQLDGVAGVHLGELARVGEVGQEREAGLAGLLDEDADRRLAALLGGTVFSPAATSSICSRSMLRSAIRFVGSRASAVW